MHQAHQELSELQVALQPTPSEAASVSQKLGDEELPDIIRVPHGFRAKPGTHIVDSLFVGPLIGKGVQGAVYDLVDGRNQPSSRVLKAVPRVALSILTSFLHDIAWEWIAGQQLNASLGRGGQLQGFMRVEAVLVSQTGGNIHGLIMEKLQGCTAKARIDAPSFCDVHYIQEMLWQVFTALDKAQRMLGFQHWDLKLSNVMEAWQSSPAHQHISAQPASCARTLAQQSSTTASSSVSTRDARQPPDNLLSTGSADAQLASSLLTPTQQPSSQRHDWKPTACPAAAGVDGARLEFKIIDYGHCEFNEEYGYECRSRKVLIDPNRTQQSGPMVKSDAHTIPCTEKAYRCFWYRRRDVYRLLLSLSNAIDGKVWPQSDRAQVEQLLQLIKHVTGAHVHAYFQDISEADHDHMWPRGVVPCFRHGGCCHSVRLLQMGLAAFLHPNNPGTTPAEALVGPFLSKHSRLQEVV